MLPLSGTGTGTPWYYKRHGRARGTPPPSNVKSIVWGTRHPASPNCSDNTQRFQEKPPISQAGNLHHRSQDKLWKFPNFHFHQLWDHSGDPWPRFPTQSTGSPQETGVLCATGWSLWENYDNLTVEMSNPSNQHKQKSAMGHHVQFQLDFLSFWKLVQKHLITM